MDDDILQYMASRRPGDPLPPKLVQSLRGWLGLNQDDFAVKLGLKAGKATISAWETGRSRCEGPAAELMLYLLRDVSGPLALSAVQADMDAGWVDGASPNRTWRQISFTPDPLVDVPREAFVRLMPEAAVPPEEHVHGFPFVAAGLPASVFGRDATGWMGQIPMRADGGGAAPSYAWRLSKTLAFAYREHAWELDPMRGGRDFRVTAALNPALNALRFAQRLGERIPALKGAKLHVRLDLEGTLGRSIRLADEYWPNGSGETPRHLPLAVTNHMTVGVELDLPTSVRDVVHGAVLLVAALAGDLRPEVTEARVHQDVRALLDNERGLPQVRFLTEFFKS